MKLFLMSLFLFISATTLQSASAPMITKVIDLHYIQAQTLIPQLNPFLSSGDKISGNDYTLILNVSPETLTTLRTIIHKLDSPPVVFDVSIHQGSADWLNAQNQNYTVYSVSSRQESGNAQSVRVMSGAAAFISMGSDTPVISAVAGGDCYGVYNSNNSNFAGNRRHSPGNNPGSNDSYGQCGAVAYTDQQLSQGFYIQPVLQGSQVKITVRRLREEVNPANQQASQNQNVETTTMIPLNKWIKLGATGQSDINSQPSTRIYSAGNSFSNDTTLFIRVKIIK